MTLVQVQLGSTTIPEPLIIEGNVGSVTIESEVGVGVESEVVMSSVKTGSVGISPLDPTQVVSNHSHKSYKYSH